MRFVEITPPEAGRLDEHKAVVELTRDDLRRLYRLASLGLRNGSPEDGALVEQLVVTQRRLLTRIDRAAAPAGEEG